MSTEFVCRVGTPEGRVMERVVQATDESAVRSDLEKQGLHVFQVRRKGLSRGLTGRLALSRLRRRRQEVDRQEFLLFNQELAALLRAGLPLLQGLDMMLERAEDEQLHAVLMDVRDRVASGENLSEAFEAHGEMFPRLYPASLKAGERSGELEQVIRRFIRYQELVIGARKKALSSLIYPAVLIGLSMLMLVVLTVYVVPSFSKFYEGLDAELPALTRAVVGLSGFLRDYGWLLALALIVGWFVVRPWMRTSAGRMVLDRWKLRIPLIGGVLHLFALSEFCRSLATLLAGGIPLVPALEIAVGAVGNASVRSAIEPEIQRVREGQAFYEAMQQSGVFPTLAVDMAKVGEATGALDEMMSNVSDFFDEKVEVRLQRILALVEPAMLVIMGAVVAVMLLSLYLPMFSALGRIG